MNANKARKALEALGKAREAYEAAGIDDYHLAGEFVRVSKLLQRAQAGPRHAQATHRAARQPVQPPSAPSAPGRLGHDPEASTREAIATYYEAALLACNLLDPLYRTRFSEGDIRRIKVQALRHAASNIHLPSN